MSNKLTPEETAERQKKLEESRAARAIERRQYMALELAKSMCSVDTFRHFSESQIALRSVCIVDEIIERTV